MVQNQHVPRVLQKVIVEQSLSQSFLNHSCIMALFGCLF